MWWIIISASAIVLGQELLQLNNAFQTKEQAQKVAEKVKELFKSL